MPGLDRVGVDADPNTCNAWQIRMHEDGWEDATMRQEDSDGTVLIDGLTYSGGLVESGVQEHLPRLVALLHHHSRRAVDCAVERA